MQKHHVAKLILYINKDARNVVMNMNFGSVISVTASAYTLLTARNMLIKIDDRKLMVVSFEKRREKKTNTDT